MLEAIGYRSVAENRKKVCGSSSNILPLGQANYCPASLSDSIKCPFWIESNIIDDMVEKEFITRIDVRLVDLDGSIASEFKICTIAISLQNFVILRINIVSNKNMFSSSIGAAMRADSANEEAPSVQRSISDIHSCQKAYERPKFVYCLQGRFYSTLLYK